MDFLYCDEVLDFRVIEEEVREKKTTIFIVNERTERTKTQKPSFVRRLDWKRFCEEHFDFLCEFFKPTQSWINNNNNNCHCGGRDV